MSGKSHTEPERITGPGHPKWEEFLKRFCRSENISLSEFCRAHNINYRMASHCKWVSARKNARAEKRIRTQNAAVAEPLDRGEAFEAIDNKVLQEMLRRDVSDADTKEVLAYLKALREKSDAKAQEREKTAVVRCKAGLLDRLARIKAAASRLKESTTFEECQPWIAEIVRGFDSLFDEVSK